MSSANEIPSALPTPASPSKHIPAPLGRALASVGRGLATGVRTVAFWAAVMLPFVVLAAAATGTPVDSTLVVELVALNVVCAVVGHSHR